MALILKDPNGAEVSLSHVRHCSGVYESQYILELVANSGIFEFLALNRSDRLGRSRRRKMNYEKLASCWRRCGRRLHLESPYVNIRVWDARKMLDEQSGQRIGVLALLLEVESESGKKYTGYYGTLQEFSGV